MPIDPNKYRHLTADNQDLTADFRPLNFEKLLAAKAFRVTHQGQDDGYNPDPKAGFSLVSAYNDASSPGKGTNLWPDNPFALPVVRDLLSFRPHDIGAHKYLQIVQSARDLGLKDEDIFLPSATMSKGYREGGRVKLI